MKCKIALCCGLLCLALCVIPHIVCAQTDPYALLSEENAIDGTYFVEVLQDSDTAEEFRNILESIAYMSISDGKTMILPFNDSGAALCYRTLDLETLQPGETVTLRAFEEGETLLRVLPRLGGFDALTDRALYRYNDDLRLIQTTMLPDALLGREGLQEALRLGGEVNQDGTLLLFETEGQDAGIYLCALQPDAQPALLLPGATFFDAQGNALEGYREGRFVGPDRVSAYLWDQGGRIAHEIFDLQGHRLYQSFVFNRRTSTETGTRESSEILRHQAEGADGILLGEPTSLDPILGTFFFLDYQTLRLDRLTSGSLNKGSLQFCAQEGSSCIMAISEWGFDEKHRSDIRFFTQDFSTGEEKERPFVLRDVSEFTAALAPGGRILFVCRDFTSGIYYRGMFLIQQDRE